MLSETDYPLNLIADKSGLTHAAYLSVLFKKHLGVTLGEFRRGVDYGGSRFSADGPVSRKFARPQQSLATRPPQTNGVVARVE